MQTSGSQETTFFAGWSKVFTYGVLQSFLAFSFYFASCLALKNDFARDYSLLIITGTLGVYNGHLLIKTFLHQRVWAIRNIIFLVVPGVGSLCILFYFKSGIEYLLHLIIPVIIAFIYLIPISKFIASGFIPGWIKPVSLAACWTWICTGPFEIYDRSNLLFVAGIFFFILTNALLFDIKDIEIDNRLNKSTFAIRHGWRITRLTACVALIISMILISLFYQQNCLGVFAAPLILGLYFIPLIKTKTDSPQSHYYWYLDGGLFLFPFAIGVIHLV